MPDPLHIDFERPRKVETSYDAVPLGGTRPKRSTLICFSHLRWDFVWQRPQHLLSRAARDFDVVIIEEPVRTADRLGLECRSAMPGVTIAAPVLPDTLSPDEETEALRGLVEDLTAFTEAQRRVFWYYTPAAHTFSDQLERALTVYDNMDELSAFAGASPALVAQEQALLSRADLVFTGGISLYEAKRARHANVHAFPSGIDRAHFVGARAARAARPRADGPPRLGFFGVIDERLDMDLLDAVACLRPDWRIDVVGPVVKIDPATLPRRSNIHWSGQAAYADLPGILACWDVGIMPFALNDATRFISPTKTPEFLAAGLPVVSTPIRDVVRGYGERGLVEIAADPDAVVAAVERLRATDRPGWLEAADRHLAGMAWDAIWDDMSRLMRDASDNRFAPVFTLHAAE